MQTPQVFEKTSYLSAVKQAVQQGADYTDDCRLTPAVEAGASMHGQLREYQTNHKRRSHRCAGNFESTQYRKE